VIEAETLDRYEVTLKHNEKDLTEHQIRPTIEGENLRLSILLYRNSAPAEPTVENTYRHVYAWTDVTNRNSTGM
jgi:uncharacterized membrane protein